METKKQTIIIRLDEKLHNDYKMFCKKHGYNMSQRLRNFIEKELTDEKINN